MNWIFGDWLRVLVVGCLVVATTGYVWVKVQFSEAAMGISQAQQLTTTLREERSKLQAAVDLAQRPNVVRSRAAKDLQMVNPMAVHTSDLVVDTALRTVRVVK